MSGGQYDAPNQQVVRPDGSAPWDEGSGGSVHGETKAKTKTATKTPDATMPEPTPPVEQPPTEEAAEGA